MTFRHSCRPNGVLLQAYKRKLLGSQLLPPDQWPELGDKEGAAARYILALVKAGETGIESDGILIPHRTVASLPSSVSDALALPALANLSVTLSFDGIMTDPNALIRMRWYDPDTRWIRVKRSGALAHWGSREGRLSVALHDLAEAVDAYNSTEGRDSEARIAAWAPVQEAVRKTTGDELQSPDDYLKSLTIYQAGAVALDVFETSYGPDFLPVMMAREMAPSRNDDAPASDVEGLPEPAQRDLVTDALLPPDLQARFARELFSGEPRSHDAYALAPHTYLVLDPDLKTVLDVVREKRATPKSERMAFLKNPRQAFSHALGDDADDLAGTLLIETWQYSERVLGLGIWEPPSMPWLKNQAGQWLPERFPLVIGDITVEMDEQVFDQLKTQVETANQEGKDDVQLNGWSLRRTDVEDAFVRLGLDREGNETQQPKDPEDPDPDQKDEDRDHQDRSDETGTRILQRLVIHQNFDGREFATAYRGRHVAIAREFPDASIATSQPKPHQTAGFDWLVSSYEAGWPGVLLADDMGLGKTYQALVFLAWLKSNRRALGSDRGARNRPTLIVAPTALLQNWVDEADRHLRTGALGSRVDAFGSALRHLRTPRDEQWSEETALDVGTLRSADWILTTYETLANYHRAFARVSFSIVVFDEAQKIKSPGAINTQSAKAMNADFVLALTGTPIENRLADLWCIMDRVVPGYLGSLKDFVRTYENGGQEELRRLKESLDSPPAPAKPSVLLRRMKTEILEGLPARQEEKTQTLMPKAQADAYAQAVAQARGGGSGQADMLRAIHAFRGISLHPNGAVGCDHLDKSSVTHWISQSARLQHTAGILRDLQRKGEKALVFVEDLDMQKTFAAAIATHLDLAHQPAVINGSVPGEKRLEIVDWFQASPLPFDLLVLSPKAAGIGLTITAANHVIHLSRWWNPAVEDQCNDRCYRIGQNKPVTIHVPIAIHPAFGNASFDMKLDALLDRKRLLSREMLMPPVEDGDVAALFSQTIGSGEAQGKPASAR